MDKKHIIYSAVNTRGKRQTSFVKAASNAQALEILSAKGFSDIELHEDASYAIYRDDLDIYSNEEAHISSVAKFELLSKKNQDFSIIYFSS